jgi:hypothetical protein
MQTIINYLDGATEAYDILILMLVIALSGMALAGIIKLIILIRYYGK